MPSRAAAPSGIHHSRNMPRMWSIRTPPACRSSDRSMSPQRRVTAGGEPLRVPGRHSPVLALLVEQVRRRADPGAASARASWSIHASAPPGSAPDGEVVDDADVHAGAPGRLLRPRELVVAHGLQPDVEPHPVGEVAPRARHRRRVRAGQLRRPPPPVAAVHLAQRAPRGERPDVLRLAAAARPDRRRASHSSSSAASFAVQARSRSTRPAVRLRSQRIHPRPQVGRGLPYPGVSSIRR